MTDWANFDFSGFSGSLTFKTANAVPKLFEPDTLLISMKRNMHEEDVRETFSKAGFSGFRRIVVDIEGERHVFSADDVVKLLSALSRSA